MYECDLKAANGGDHGGPPPPGPVRIGAFFMGGMPFHLQEDTEIVSDQPYQAEAVTQIKQTLADGTHIDQTITATVARDRYGRTVRSQKLGQDSAFFSVFRAPGISDRSPAGSAAPTLTVIFNPIAKKHIDYLSDVKLAPIMSVEISPREQDHNHVRTSTGVVHAEGGAGARVLSGGGPAVAILGFPPGDGFQQNAKTESLGRRTIEGLETVGTRKTWTIPRGTIGNDRKLVTTEETWYSPKLRLIVQSVRDDPQFGQMTYALRNIRLTEPSRKVFEIPPGYRIERLPAPPPPPGPPAEGGPR
jgi:hypothetical protein